MRKNNYIILFIATACVLASCMTGNDVYPENGSLTKTGISFVITDTDEDTKALEVTTENITSFEATAMYAGSESQYFGSFNFTGTGSPKKFTSSSSPLWPKGSSLDFYAYSTGSATGQVSKSNYKTFTVTPASSAAAQVDFVYACGKDQNINTLVDGSAQLTFLHTQSKVSVRVKNTSSDFKAVITGWRLGYFDESGTFTHDGTATTSISAFDPSCWTNNTSPSALNTYTMDLSESPVSVAASAVEAISLPGEMIVVPQSTLMATNYANAISGAKVNGSYVALKIKLMDDYSSEMLYGGEDGEWAIWPVGFKWNPGMNYTYTINIAREGYVETNPGQESTELANINREPTFTFAGLEIAPAPLYHNGTSFIIKDDDWNHDSYNSTYAAVNGSYYFNWNECAGVSGVSYNGHSDWRMPTQAEWAAVTTGSRTGSTINGTSGCRYALIRLTGVTHAGSSSPYGLLLAPDGRRITGMAKTFNWNVQSTSGNTGVTAAQLDQYLDAGCVFLPASGYRSSSSWTGNGSNGMYWSSTQGSSSSGTCLIINSSSVNPSRNISKTNYFTCRLVRSVQ